MEYLQEWKVVTENDDTTTLFLKYGVRTVAAAKLILETKRERDRRERERERGGEGDRGERELL